MFQSQSLAEFWQQTIGEDDEITKVAAASGLSPDEYYEALAEQQVAQELMQKQAEEDELTYGLLIHEGIKTGGSGFLSKLAAHGGNVAAAKNLKDLFFSE